MDAAAGAARAGKGILRRFTVPYELDVGDLAVYLGPRGGDVVSGEEEGGGAEGGELEGGGVGSE